MKELMLTSLFSAPYKTLAIAHLERFTYGWEALEGIGDFIIETIKGLDSEKFLAPAPDIRIAKSAKVAPSAVITGPCIIDENAEIRQGAFIRGNAIIGRDCVVGNSCEIKNSILFDRVQVPHFNYVGDSILGYASHMGAGAVTSNVKMDKTHVKIEGIDTGRKKVGAILGDFVEVGCNSVLNPGTVIGSSSCVYPVSSVRGYVPANSIWKSKESVIPKKV
jgi:NDP-sugar pyrophosphorylase family protein